MIVPDELFNKNLSPIEILITAQLSQEYMPQINMADKFGVSESTITRAIRKMKETKTK